MPVYNGSKYIIETIPNILKNDYSDFELILVNDGSSDESLDICNSFSVNDKRVVVLDKKNGGIADARNFGITHAKGEYLAFVDQDDFINLNILYENFKKYDDDVLLYSTVKNYKTKQEPCDIIYAYDSFLSSKDIFNNLVWPMVFPNVTEKKVSYLGHVWQGVYKREMVEKNQIGFKKFISIEDDFIFLLEVLLSSKSVSLIPQSIYYWTINTNSETYKNEYILEFKKKYENYNHYVTRILEKSKYFDESKRYDYYKLSSQVLAVRMVINEGNRNNIIDSYKLIKNYCKGVKICLQGEYLSTSASRKSAKYIYLMLKNNFILLAILLQKIIILIK